jgi:hypothetical protein
MNCLLEQLVPNGYVSLSPVVPRNATQSKLNLMEIEIIVNTLFDPKTYSQRIRTVNDSVVLFRNFEDFIIEIYL